MEQHERMKRFQEHLKHEHKRSAVSTYFKEVIYGGVDGIITTFAVVAGFSGAALSNESTTQLSFLVVLLFGLANLFADATSMGLGSFLSVRSEQSLYCNIRSREKRESEHNGDYEAEETKTILISKGFSKEDAETLTALYRKNEQYWLDFMMNHELKMPDPTDENPFYTGLATFCAFVFFGFIPLIPFMAMSSFDPQTVFQFSIAGTLSALVLLGVLKWKVTGTRLVRTVAEVVIVGSFAATIAFLVGTLFTI